MESELLTLFDQKIVIHHAMINSMPNEMLRKFLRKLDILELIAIRGVCKKWLAVIVDICREKKSLVIERKYDCLGNFELSERFNRLVDLNNQNCVVVFTIKSEKFLTISLNNDSSNLLATLFPNVENLLINSDLDITTETTENVLYLLKNWSSSITTLLLPSSSNFAESHQSELLEHINNLSYLKRLNFWDLDLLNPATLARLEHCLFTGNSKIVPLLTPNCTSLCLYHVSLSDIREWPKLNAPLVKNLTHLRLYIHDSEFLPFVCYNFKSLQMLDMDFSAIHIFNPGMIAHLARLTNLSQLSIHSLKVDMPTLVQTKFLSINSVKILFISCLNVSRNTFVGKEFCRVLSNIFPNLEQIMIKHEDPIIRASIYHSLNHFVHLRKRVIVP